MEQYRVRFLPDGAEAWVPSGSTLLAAAAAAHVAIDAPCGDRGICGKCRVRVASPLEPPTLPELTLIPPEEIQQGWRLACQARVVGDTTVTVPERALQPAVVPLSEIEPHPAVRKLHLRLPEPTLEDPISDAARLRRALAGEIPDLSMDLPALQRLPQALSAASYDVTAVAVGKRLVALETGGTSTSCAGLAVDLGTTSVVAILVDLVTGRTLGVESRLNGQANYGADVISRITHATSQPKGLQELQSAAVATINSALADLLKRTGIDREQIYEAVVVGNSCMNHLLLGINPASLAAAPYQPVVAEPVSCRAQELGIAINPSGQLYTLPNVAGFVGSDTVAVILATAMHRSEEIRLAIDLGTNGEIVLGNRDRLLTCSTAAGPAFEGAKISAGMRATEGAIERVWIHDGEVKTQVIGSGGAIGLCGSGLLDAVAQMRGAGLLNGGGRLISPEKADGAVVPRLLQRLVRDGAQGFVLARRGRRPVVLTQADVRQFQLAKGAIRAGISILLKEFGIGEGDVSEILLAGAFGSYVNPASAKAVGLVPPLPIDRITAVGNAAGQGAVMALLSTDLREQANLIARTAEHVELSARSDFMEQ
ncbi:MAG: ASKHA domain-containing protein, partial [Chloroflexota bacterium]